MSIEEPGKSLGYPLVGIDGSVLMLSAQLLVLCATFFTQIKRPTTTSEGPTFHDFFE
jgi:hypothetical protein